MSDRPSLCVLMNRHGTDKLWMHHYDGEYTRHFEPLRDRPIRLLEIGIGGYGMHGRGGHSLHVWRDYGPTWQVFGLDIEDKSFLDGDRITTIKGDQSDTHKLVDIDNGCGPFDIVIDDGSHRQADILTSFHTLFPLLASGGIYVIEDLETAYRNDHGGHPEPLAAGGSVNLIADLIDGLHHQFWHGRVPDAIQRSVKSVHVSKELVFIYKA